MTDLTTVIFTSLTALAVGAFGFLLKTLANKEAEIQSKNIEINNLNKRIDDLTDLVFEAVMIIKTNDSKTRVQKADQIIERLKQLKI